MQSNRPTERTRWSIRRRIVLLGLAVPLFLCFGVIMIWGVIPQIGRIGGFQAFTDGSTVPGAAYVIRFDPPVAPRLSIWLENPVSRTKIPLFADIYVPGRLGFTTFTYHDRLFLVTRMSGGGSADNWFYRVYDLSTDPPQERTTTDPEMGLMVGSACDSPKLDGSSLVFEGGEKCRLFGFIPHPLSHEYR